MAENEKSKMYLIDLQNIINDLKRQSFNKDISINYFEKQYKYFFLTF